MSTTTLAQPPVPRTAPCRSCGTPIYWAPTAKGKQVPMNPATGRSHFEDCPQARQWRGKGR